MALSKKTKKIGFWLGLAFVLVITLIGILFITNVITFQITGKFFGWFLIILSVYSAIEYFIVTRFKI